MFKVGETWEYTIEGGKPKRFEILGFSPDRKFMQIRYKRGSANFHIPDEKTRVTYSAPGYVQFFIFNNLASLRWISGASLRA
jgi:hypothetical protein